MRLRVEVLDELAESKGCMSVAALARETGIHRSTIFRWRAGEVDASGPNARRLARFLGTSVEALFEETVA